MAKEKICTADRVKAIVEKAIESRSDEMCIGDVRITNGGYFIVDLSGSVFTDELNEISREVCDRKIGVYASDHDKIKLIIKPGNDLSL